MEIKRKTEIYVETTRRFLIHQPESIERLFCSACNAPMLAAEQAAAVFQINCRAVYQIIETGAAHFVETERGVVLVCPASLAAILEAGAKQLSGETAVEKPNV